MAHRFKNSLDPRNVRLRCYVSEYEKTCVEEAAGDALMDVSAYIRHKILGVRVPFRGDILVIYALREFCLATQDMQRAGGLFPEPMLREIRDAALLAIDNVWKYR